MRTRKGRALTKLTRKRRARPKIIKPSPPSAATQGPSVAPRSQKPKPLPILLHMDAGELFDLVNGKLDFRRALIGGMVDLTPALRELGEAIVSDAVVRTRAICFEGTEDDRHAIESGAREFLRLMRRRAE